jgi:hypothetical protein
MKRNFVLAIASLLVVWLFVPLTEVISPEWTVLVSDTAGRPIGGASVTVYPQHHPFESRDTEETQVTGDDGRTVFPQRKLRATGLARLYKSLVGLVEEPLANLGGHTFLVVSKPGFTQPSTPVLIALNERESLAHRRTRQYSHVVLSGCPPDSHQIGCDRPTVPDKDALIDKH